MAPEFAPTRAVLHIEDCDMHYWSQGKGPLIVFIPGGNGHGRQYDTIIASLSDRYTCATFDRRQMSASQAKVNKRLNPPQQARDIRAIIEILGFDKATLFGSSMGGILAFQFALDFPDMVEHVISHEAPTFMLLPNATEVFEFLYNCLEIYEASGVDAAQKEFSSKLIGYFDEGVPRTGPSDPMNPPNHWANEFAVLLGYLPSLYRIRENGTSIGLMRGIRSREAWYAQAVDEQAKILGCPKLDVAGAHEGFRVECEAFLPYFVELMDILDKAKGKSSR
ncbi:acetyltransferase/esterase [Colletotrichum simmondsii]|uniref:Acetyltransferase/esterase n=1 Tax=Colletotrichum simmondsii TaxID=703756 RepID=A0A135TZQ2_9PEZI|nr:acetyltransferase/esterase [Colletotrichum simmondsii]